MPDGSIYYGHVVEVLPFEFRPKDGSIPAGFQKKLLIVSSSRATSIDALSEPTSVLDYAPSSHDSPLIVENISLVAEEFHAHITKVRHGFGI